MTVGQIRTNAAEVLKDDYLLESAKSEERKSFRRYAEYRDSGVEWVEEVPVGWTIKKLKFVVEVQPSNVDKKTKENEKTVLLCNYTDVYYNEEITGDLPFMRATASDLQIKKFTLKSGDTIITKDSEDPDDIAVPAYIPQDLEGIICGYHLALLRPKYGILGGYLKRIMDSRYARSVFAAKANGLTRYGLGIYAINNFALPLPPIEEQRQITAYLNRETAKIDSLVARQEQLIELLREKRQAVISHAVTKGLNPNAKMKDSGVEWLREVPEHWEVKQIKHILLQKKGAIKTGPFGSQLTSRDMEGTDIKVINQRNVIDNDFDFGTNFINQEKYIELQSFTIFPRDILITTRGTIGRTAIAPNRNGKSILHPCLMRLQVDEKHWLKELVSLIIQSSGYFLEQLKILSNATTIDVIYSENLKNITIALPSTSKEQEEIVAFIDKETAKIDILIERCETAIKLFKERRIALISAAVTGKIDIHHAT